MDLAQFWFQGASGGPGPTPPFPIGNSLRFRGAQSLSRVPASNGNRQTFTHSFWLKKIGVVGTITSAGSGAIFSTQQQSTQERFRTSNSEETGFGQIWNAGGRYQGIQGRYTDPGGWYHVVAAFDSTQAAAADRLKIYINGELKTRTSNADITQNQNWTWNSTLRHNIGKLNTNDGTPAWDTNFLQGYLAEYHMVDGTALEPGTFGEFNADGVWVPREVEGVTYGTNGFYLDFSDPDDIGADRSGNNNDFTATGFELTNIGSRYLPYDWVADSPTNNYSTYNPLDLPTGNIGSANLTHGQSAASYGNARNGFRIPSSGRWALEVQTSGMGSSGTSHWGFAMEGSAYNTATNFNYAATSTGNANPANLSINGTGVGQHTFTSVFRLEVDMDASPPSVQTFRGGTSINTQDWTDYDGTSDVYFYTRAVNGSSFAINYGQQPLTNAASAGFEPLSTAGLPDVAITNPSEHFQTILGISDPRPDAPVIGEERGGGFFAGLIRDGNEVFELIVAPPSEGNLSGENALHWGNFGSDNKCPASPNGDDLDYGGNTTFNLGGGSGQWLAFEWIRQDANGPNAGAMDLVNGNVPTGTGIGGYNDWYMPALREALVLYWSLKPTTVANTGGWIDGSNPSAFPPTPAYTASNPAQTSVASFREGGANALGTLANGNYWTASLGQRTSTCAAWMLQPAGTQPGSAFFNGAVGGNRGFRVVRRQFAFNAGILEQAQTAFPNGLWWIKDRANSNQHQLVDSVRGNNQMVQTPGTGRGNYVAPAGNSVAWCWATPGNEVTNNDGSQPSQCDANVAAGFSVITYQGGTLGATYGHGLQGEPDFIMARRFDANGGWMCYHSSLGKDSWIDLGSSNSATNSNNVWGVNAPTDAVFGVSNTTTNRNSEGSVVAYCWRSVPGFSAFGTYQGNNNVDGPFCFTGFRPGWILIKQSAGGNGGWAIYDTHRSTFNPAIASLRSNETTEEQQLSAVSWDILSNGFKVRNNNANYNSSGSSFIWASFAEHPFGGGNVSPSPAR